MLDQESNWCFNELVLMADSMLESRSTILRVFYGVSTLELGWTWGRDGVDHRILDILEEKKGLDLQKPRYDTKTLEKWRTAPIVVAEISGFGLKSIYRDEEQLVDKVFVSKAPLNIAKYPTDLDGKEKDVKKIEHSERVRVMGIVGLGGVGKMSLVEKIFNRHRSIYDQS